MAVATASGHIPVLAERSVELLRPRTGAVIVDATLGLGGHAERLLGAGATVIGLDRDRQALGLARDRLAHFGQRLRPVHATFGNLASALDEAGVGQVDGILYDLGVSSLQLDEGERGFSYRYDAPLDMRMDPTSGPTAADVVNGYPTGDLARVLREYGEERFAGRIASFIGNARRRAPLRTTGELVEVVKAAIPAAARRSGPHPARRTFQALRIEVNGELAELERSLPQAIDRLAPGGRVVVISYHSLEDRIVKRALAAAAGGGDEPDLPGLPVVLPRPDPVLRILTRRPEVPGPAEVDANPRAESAKLRAAEKIARSSLEGR